MQTLLFLLLLFILLFFLSFLVLFLKICPTFNICFVYYPLLTFKYHHWVIIYIFVSFFFLSTVILFGYDSHIVLFDISQSLEFLACVS